jgi:hypothetical protein
MKSYDNLLAEFPTFADLLRDAEVDASELSGLSVQRLYQTITKQGVERTRSMLMESGLSRFDAQAVIDQFFE